MKYLGLGLFLVALVAGHVLAIGIRENNDAVEDSQLTRSMSDKFRAFLENLKITIREGNSSLGIPVLDPFVSDYIGIDLDEDIIKGTASLSNFEVHGLAGYNIDKATIALLSRKIVLGLTWPQIYSAGSYELDVTALDKFHIFGKGDYKVTVTDLSFETAVWLAVSNGVKIKKMETSISLGALDFSASGLFNDEKTSKVLSEVISELAPEIVNDYQELLTSKVNEVVTETANELLEGMSLSDLLAILG